MKEESKWVNKAKEIANTNTKDNLKRLLYTISDKPLAFRWNNDRIEYAPLDNVWRVLLEWQVLPLDYEDPALPLRKTRPRLCSVSGCNEIHAAKGLCSNHYQYARKHGGLLT